MKPLLFAVAAGISMGTLLGTGSETEVLSSKSTEGAVPDSEKELHAIMRNACGEANEYYAAQGFPTFEQSTSGFNTQSRSFPAYKKQVLFLWTGLQSKGPQLGILPDSHRVFLFNKGQAFDDATHAPSSPNRLPPKWAKDHAVSLGRGFADIFVKPWQTHLVLNDEMTSFSWLWQDIDTKTKTSIYEPGQWTIRWQRATASGIPYESDMVIVEETEADGPFGVCIYFATDYDETQSEKTITEGTALAVAAQGCRGALIERPLPDAKLVHAPPTIRLLIVSPADGMVPLKNFPNPTFFSQSKGRLVWRVNYQITTSERYLAGDLIIYVDALDGKILGCFYPEPML